MRCIVALALAASRGACLQRRGGEPVDLGHGLEARGEARRRVLKEVIRRDALLVEGRRHMDDDCEAVVDEARVHRDEVLTDRLYHGTTTVAFTFEGGLVCAVDSRASLGVFVGSSATEKVLPISEHVLATMAGSAADCSTWIRLLSARAKLHEMESGERFTASVASQLLARSLRGARGRDMSLGTMIMGIDARGRPELYYCDSEGHRVKGDIFAVGSGATFAYSVLDAHPHRAKLDARAACALAERAVRTAATRDAYSGGLVNVFVVDGTTRRWARVNRADTALGRGPRVSRRLPDDDDDDDNNNTVDTAASSSASSSSHSPTTTTTAAAVPSPSSES